MKRCCSVGNNEQAIWPLSIDNACLMCGHSLQQDGYHIGKELWRCKCGTEHYTCVLGVVGQELRTIGLYFEDGYCFHNYYEQDRWSIGVVEGLGFRWRVEVWQKSGPGCWPLGNVNTVRARIMVELGKENIL